MTTTTKKKSKRNHFQIPYMDKDPAEMRGFSVTRMPSDGMTLTAQRSSTQKQPVNIKRLVHTELIAAASIPSDTMFPTIRKASGLDDPANSSSDSHIGRTTLSPTRQR